MGMTLITRRFAAWLAAFAILFAALAPSISHALSAARGETWAEICSTGGAKLVKVSVGQDGTSIPATGKSFHFEHCPFCITHGGSFALLPGAGIALPLPEAQNFRPFLFYQSPRPLPIWTAAQSRAPPVLA